MERLGMMPFLTPAHKALIPDPKVLIADIPVITTLFLIVCVLQSIVSSFTAKCECLLHLWLVQVYSPSPLSSHPGYE